MTHTSAPWEFVPDPYDDGTPYFRFRAGDPYVDGEKMGFSFTAIMREDDARLLAAAPDLLQALKAAREQGEDRQAFTYQLMIQIDAAIAKATQR